MQINIGNIELSTQVAFSSHLTKNHRVDRGHFTVSSILLHSVMLSRRKKQNSLHLYSSPTFKSFGLSRASIPSERCFPGAIFANIDNDYCNFAHPVSINSSTNGLPLKRCKSSKQQAESIQALSRSLSLEED